MNIVVEKALIVILNFHTIQVNERIPIYEELSFSLTSSIDVSH